MFRLDNKTALVTGAGSGIGAAIAEAFALAGAFVFVSDREEKSGRIVAANIAKGGGKAEFQLLDVTDETQCAAAVERVHSRGGGLDVLVNNAGIGHVGTILQTTGKD